MLRRIQDHPVLVVPGKMQGSFFRLEVMALWSAVGTDSVGTGLDGEAGPDGKDIWRGEIHLEVLELITLNVSVLLQMGVRSKNKQ